VTCLTASDLSLLETFEQKLEREFAARKAYFAREIAEVMRIAVKPRILALGAGPMDEASDAIYAAHLHHAEFVAIEADSEIQASLRRKYSQSQFQVLDGGWNDLAALASTAGLFDLIYSPSWLDATDDRQARKWLAACMEMLRPGGRILAANFAHTGWNSDPCCRSEEDLAQLVINLKDPKVRGHAVFRDESGASAYLEIHSL